ncbi:MAG: glycine cleavage system aminomethyltransferase GcvT [Alicyclobacillus sp.]|nr:glycine cleavage system aminomethyltransferase GcvT [Alicyclobacillus sp.]
MRRTPLFDVYRRAGAKTVEFAGWELPLQFSGILAEHERVRTHAGLFDVSHMGEIQVRGPAARDWLQGLLTNDVSKLSPGGVQYSLLTNDRGGCLDDLLVYCVGADHFWLVVNAANTEQDVRWLQDHAVPGVHLVDRSDEVALLALQGPAAQACLQAHTADDLSSLAPFRWRRMQVCGCPAAVSRTGYTGEDGFEIYLAAADAPGVWTTLLDQGSAYGVLPAGLGARDTLRLEAALPLYGQELRADITPLEAGLGAFVKLQKGPFPGHGVLMQQKVTGVQRKLVGLRLADRQIARSGYRVLLEGRQVGWVTSGTLSPTLRVPIALAYVPVAYAAMGTCLTVDVRGRMAVAEVVPIPFYQRPRPG